MADPLSVSASLVGLVTVGIQVTKGLLNYYRSCQGQNTTIEKTLRRLEDLSAALQNLDEAVQQRSKNSGAEDDLLERISENVENCAESINELQSELQKFEASSSDKGPKALIKTASRKLAYPFRESTLQKLEEDIADIRENISLALSVLHLKDHDHIQNDLDAIKDLITLIDTRQVSDSLDQWLKAPDPTTNHRDACSKRHASTGLWFIQSSEFQQWLTQQNSCLWLTGFGGSGKSVLCSTAIQSTFQHRNGDPQIGICFFYFTFTDDSKQDIHGMIRAILMQLSIQAKDDQLGLKDLNKKYKHSSPPLQDLIATLNSVVKKFQHVYLLLDALDESPKITSRPTVLQALAEFHSWALPGLHILITSRDEPDIREYVHEFVDEVHMDDQKVDEDIANYVESILQTSPAFRKWSSKHDWIKQSLASRAKGVFRLVECQLQSLAHSPRSDIHLEKCLESLPPTLEEFYARVLREIDATLKDDARRILLLLCFALRPLTVEEVIEGVAVQLRDNPRLAPEYRLQDEDDIFRICPSFIRATYYAVDGVSPVPLGPKFLSIAHFSVQQYLTSDRILTDQNLSFFHLQSSTGHSELAQICLFYLQDPEVAKSKDSPSSGPTYAFDSYAGQLWDQHIRICDNLTDAVEYAILRFFNDASAFESWKTRHQIEIVHVWDFEEDCSPINLAAALNLTRVASHLLSFSEENYGRPSVCTEVDVAGHRSKINEGGMQGENPLQVSSHRGFKDMVRLLLAAGADPNVESNYSPLILASEGGHEEIVRMLLNAGADANLQGLGGNENALRAACRMGKVNIVERLLDKGANPNGYHVTRYLGGGIGEMCESALTLAVIGTRTEVVQLLLERGADPNDHVLNLPGPLELATYRGKIEIVKALLHHGANINANKEGPLRKAIGAGHEKVVEVLLRAGANLRLGEEECGSILSLAIFEGLPVDCDLTDKNNESRVSESLIQMLIDEGANINAMPVLDPSKARSLDYCFYPPLHSAVRGNRKTIASLLLKNGAKVNAEHSHYGCALHVALVQGDKELIEVLLEHGANVNTQAGPFAEALCIAVIEKREDIRQLLLDRGARDLSEEEVTEKGNATLHGSKILWLRVRGLSHRFSLRDLHMVYWIILQYNPYDTRQYYTMNYDSLSGLSEIHYGLRLSLLNEIPERNQATVMLTHQI